MVMEKVLQTDAEVLMEPVKVSCDGITFACGAVRREHGRRISGSVFLNGREIKSIWATEHIYRNVFACICESDVFRGQDYDFIFAVSKVCCFENSPLEETIKAFSWDLGRMDCSDVRYTILSDYSLAVGRCVIRAFNGCFK